MFFFWMLCYFYARCNGTHTFQKVQPLSRQSTEYFPKSLGDHQMFSGKLRWAFMFFLLSSGFGLGTLPCRPFLPSLFLMVESWTLTLTEASEACSSLDVVVGSFVTSWMSRRCALGVILVGRPLLGRFTTVPCFLHLWIMALTVVRWSPKALEWLYNLSQTDRSQLLSFSFVPEFLWISTWCVAFEDILVYFTLSGRFYLSDFLIANRCGSNQAWMWLEKLNSGVINHSYVLKENATVFPYSNMFFPQLRRVDMYLSRLSPCT